MDLDLELDLTRPAETDQLADTVSYEEVYLTAQHMAGGGRCKLLEHLAASVADGMLAQFAILEAVTVSLRKMNLPFPNTCREVEVVFMRKRPS
jgi:dihydroneopterin aldolase